MSRFSRRAKPGCNWFEDYGGDLLLGSTAYAYVNGKFQIELPVGECYVEIAKGFEYEPVRAKLMIEPGQSQLALPIHRRYALRKQGWVTADTHVHFLSPQTAWLEAQAEGLNLVNLLASQWGNLFTSICDITGDQSNVSRDDTIVWVGTENRQHLLGHISLLGGNGSPVFPMCASGPGESYFGDPAWSSLAEWADRCREREGVVIIPHFPNPYAEVVADIILGKVDGVEIRDFHSPTLNTYGVAEWYRFLNLGYRVAAVGGTDKMSAGMPVGGVRTYAQLGENEFTFANWGRAVRAGRTFTTSGPLIGLQVEDKSLGDHIELPRGGGTLELHAWAHSVHAFDRLQVVLNGQVIAEEKSENGTRAASIKTRVNVDRSSWLAARCLGSHKAWHCWPIHIAAHTSPIYIAVDARHQFNSTDAGYMLSLLEGGMTWLDTLAIPVDANRHATIRRVFENASEQLRQRINE
ncbi:MAG: CehA/McbA family metallohydrolase [Chloroflexi bacterium]|nr:CehA/McbA family metallohydrolase [Chloroflexota bacterium]